ncbi:MAG TPA: TetR/AcrR family transcriptional regulator, partial [Acidimicrobiales bacterium]|nr:TetR/AcrR family transcriptional regulator [Acidimicrobiales bacterium]
PSPSALEPTAQGAWPQALETNSAGASDIPGSVRQLRADALRNRTKVIEAAIEAFSAEGVSVPMDAIAERAGVGVGTIYRQFPTKEALYRAVVHYHLDQVLEELRQLVSAEDAGEALFGFVARLLEMAASKQDLVEMLERSGIAFKGVKDEWEGEKEWLESFAVLVERAQAAGAVRADVRVDDVIALVGGTCAAVNHHDRDAASRDRLAKVVCDGLRA